MNVAVRCGTVMTVLVLSTACGGRDSVSPPTAPTPQAPPRVGVAPPFPAVTQPARVYVRKEDEPYSRYHGSPLASRYLLYDDGTFALQYASANHPLFEYPGTYEEANALVTFNFKGMRTEGPWGAIGTLTGDALTVKYDVIMQHSDFTDGVFVLTR